MHSKRGRKRKNADVTPAADASQELVSYGRVKHEEKEDDIRPIYVPPAVRYSQAHPGPGQYSLPQDPQFGHYFFVSANFCQRLRLFVDIPSALSVSHQPQFWSHVSGWKHEFVRQLSVAQLAALLVYSSAALVGSHNSAVVELSKSLLTFFPPFAVPPCV